MTTSTQVKQMVSATTRGEVYLLNYNFVSYCSSIIRPLERARRIIQDLDVRFQKTVNEYMGYENLLKAIYTAELIGEYIEKIDDLINKEEIETNVYKKAEFLSIETLALIEVLFGYIGEYARDLERLTQKILRDVEIIVVDGLYESLEEASKYAEQLSDFFEQNVIVEPEDEEAVYGLFDSEEFKNTISKIIEEVESELKNMKQDHDEELNKFLDKIKNYDRKDTNQNTE